mmetsp:Transcript_26815/g.56378  ORF Transcript_26815/g.56378 Transcript_26815/m.56378 type:complete len:521 (+) Transcript_26815:99-1661(+)
MPRQQRNKVRSPLIPLIMHFVHDSISLSRDGSQNPSAGVTAVVDALRIMDVDETKLRVNIGVDVGLIGVGDGEFGLRDDVDVLGGVDVVAWVGLVVGFAECVECVRHHNVQDAAVIALSPSIDSSSHPVPQIDDISILLGESEILQTPPTVASIVLQLPPSPLFCLFHLPLHKLSLLHQTLPLFLVQPSPSHGLIITLVPVPIKRIDRIRHAGIFTGVILPHQRLSSHGIPAKVILIPIRDDDTHVNLLGVAVLVDERRVDDGPHGHGPLRGGLAVATGNGRLAFEVFKFQRRVAVAEDVVGGEVVLIDGGGIVYQVGEGVHSNFLDASPLPPSVDSHVETAAIAQSIDVVVDSPTKRCRGAGVLFADEGHGTGRKTEIDRDGIFGQAAFSGLGVDEESGEVHFHFVSDEGRIEGVVVAIFVLAVLVFDARGTLQAVLNHDGAAAAACAAAAAGKRDLNDPTGFGSVADRFSAVQHERGGFAVCRQHGGGFRQGMEGQDGRQADGREFHVGVRFSSYLSR